MGTVLPHVSFPTLFACTIDHSVVCLRLQDTKLDMTSLGPVLDEAFAAAGILQRPELALQDSKLR